MSDLASTGIKEVAISEIVQRDLQNVNDIPLGWGQLGDKTVDPAVFEEYAALNDVLECSEKVFSAGIANIPAVGHEIVQAAVPVGDIVAGSTLHKDNYLESDFE